MAEINDIEADEITEEQSHSLKEECCSICLDHFTTSTLVKKMGCGHIFHQTCIDAWLVRKGECPNCKF